MRLDDNYIKQLRDLPIEQVARRLGLELTHGKTYCLWHPDKHPSLTIDQRHNRVKCWACGKSADTIELVMKANNLSFREACDYLGDPPQPSLIGREQNSYYPRRDFKQYPPDIAFLSELVQYPVLIPEAQRFLYDERKIDPRVVRWCGLSSSPVSMPCYRGGRPFYEGPCLLIPYRDVDGRLLTVQSRYLGNRTTEVTGSLPQGRAGGESIFPTRFRYPRGSNTKIYNLPVLKMLQGNEPLLIMEGCSDCWSALSAGHKAIAIGSATLLRKEDLMAALTPCLDRWNGAIEIWPDADSAGEALAQKLVSLSLEMQLPLVRHSLPAGCKDYSEMRAKC